MTVGHGPGDRGTSGLLDLLVCDRPDCSFQVGFIDIEALEGPVVVVVLELPGHHPERIEWLPCCRGVGRDESIARLGVRQVAQVRTTVSDVTADSPDLTIGVPDVLCPPLSRAGPLRLPHSACVGPPDRWADWLIRGRQRGFDERQIRALAKELRRVRDRVLAGARLREGVRVLDVGAGTGLLAVEARRRVGEFGRVIALDISTDALAAFARRGIGLSLIAGDAIALPLPDESVDVVVMRSALIYVSDKLRAATEFHRVLRPGGRVSLFEPINSQYKSLADVDLSDLEPARSRVLERWQSGGDPGGAMGGFDDRDLVGHFVNAGFETVELTHEIVHRRSRVPDREVWASLTMRPNPNMVSYEEAAHEVLVSTADEHLASLVSALTKRPSTSVDDGAYLRARRARR